MYNLGFCAAIIEAVFLVLWKYGTSDDSDN